MRTMVDPERLIAFASFLDNQCDDIKLRKIALVGDFSDLKEVWKDEKYLRFEGIFEENMQRLDTFLKQLGEISLYLKTKARIAEKYFESNY